MNGGGIPVKEETYEDRFGPVRGAQHWSLDQKIDALDLRRAAFEYAYGHRYFTAEQPGAPDTHVQDLEAMNEAGPLTYKQVEIDGESQSVRKGWDWRVPVAPPADMGQPESPPSTVEMKPILDQDQWDPAFDQQTAYTDANTYLLENFNVTLDSLDRLLVDDMGIEQDNMDWAEFRPGPPDQNLLAKIWNPVLQGWKETGGKAVKWLTKEETYEDRFGPVWGAQHWSLDQKEGVDLGGALSLGWTASEDDNPLEPNPTQANREWWVGEPNSLSDIFVPHTETQAWVDLGLLFFGGSVLRGLTRIPRIILRQIERNSLSLSRVLPRTIQYLQRATPDYFPSLRTPAAAAGGTGRIDRNLATETVRYGTDPATQVAYREAFILTEVGYVNRAGAVVRPDTDLGRWLAGRLEVRPPLSGGGPHLPPGPPAPVASPRALGPSDQWKDMPGPPGGAGVGDAMGIYEDVGHAWQEMYGIYAADTVVRDEWIKEGLPVLPWDQPVSVSGLSLEVGFDYTFGTGVMRPGASDIENMSFWDLADAVSRQKMLLEKHHPEQFQKMVDELRRRGLDPDDYMMSHLDPPYDTEWDITALTEKAKELDVLDVVEGRRVKGPDFHLRTEGPQRGPEEDGVITPAGGPDDPLLPDTLEGLDARIRDLKARIAQEGESIDPEVLDELTAEIEVLEEEFGRRVLDSDDTDMVNIDDADYYPEEYDTSAEGVRQTVRDWIREGGPPAPDNIFDDPTGFLYRGDPVGRGIGRQRLNPDNPFADIILMLDEVGMLTWSPDGTARWMPGTDIERFREFFEGGPFINWDQIVNHLTATRSPERMFLDELGAERLAELKRLEGQRELEAGWQGEPGVEGMQMTIGDEPSATEGEPPTDMMVRDFQDEATEAWPGGPSLFHGSPFQFDEFAGMGTAEGAERQFPARILGDGVYSTGDIDMAAGYMGRRVVDATADPTEGHLYNLKFRSDRVPRIIESRGPLEDDIRIIFRGHAERLSERFPDLDITELLERIDDPEASLAGILWGDDMAGWDPENFLAAINRGIDPEIHLGTDLSHDEIMVIQNEIFGDIQTSLQNAGVDAYKDVGTRLPVEDYTPVYIWLNPDDLEIVRSAGPFGGSYNTGLDPKIVVPVRTPKVKQQGPPGTPAEAEPLWAYNEELYASYAEAEEMGDLYVNWQGISEEAYDRAWEEEFQRMWEEIVAERPEEIRSMMRMGILDAPDDYFGWRNFYRNMDFEPGTNDDLLQRVIDRAKEIDARQGGLTPAEAEPLGEPPPRDPEDRPTRQEERNQLPVKEVYRDMMATITRGLDDVFGFPSMDELVQIGLNFEYTDYPVLNLSGVTWGAGPSTILTASTITSHWSEDIGIFSSNPRGALDWLTWYRQTPQTRATRTEYGGIGTEEVPGRELSSAGQEFLDDRSGLGEASAGLALRVENGIRSLDQIITYVTEHPEVAIPQPMSAEEQARQAGAMDTTPDSPGPEPGFDAHRDVPYGTSLLADLRRHIREVYRDEISEIQGMLRGMAERPGAAGQRMPGGYLSSEEIDEYERLFPDATGVIIWGPAGSHDHSFVMDEWQNYLGRLADLRRHLEFGLG